MQAAGWVGGRSGDLGLPVAGAPVASLWQVTDSTSFA